MTVDASGLSYCDGSGLGLLLEIRRRQEARGAAFELRGLAEQFRALLDLFGPAGVGAMPGPRRRGGLVEGAGRAAAGLLADVREMVGFVGTLTFELCRLALRPMSLRWKDAFWAAERAGVNALPIVALIGFLIGLIMAFQAAMPMRKFGAEIYAADLVAISTLRELGPLMTAIVLAGRSGSAFAAEIGTMKVNEEVNALTTMGLSPFRFLVLPRVVATVAMTPLLTVFTNLCGLIGGAVVLVIMGFPLVTYANQVSGAVGMADLLGGLAKAVVFGVLVAGAGCLKGLQTKTGASAVGESTTRAVVAGIVLILVSDGVFSVVYYALGI